MVSEMNVETEIYKRIEDAVKKDYERMMNAVHPSVIPQLVGANWTENIGDRTSTVQMGRLKHERG